MNYTHTVRVAHSPSGEIEVAVIGAQGLAIADRRCGSLIDASAFVRNEGFVLGPLAAEVKVPGTITQWFDARRFDA